MRLTRRLIDELADGSSHAGNRDLGGHLSAGMDAGVCEAMGEQASGGGRWRAALAERLKVWSATARSLRTHQQPDRQSQDGETERLMTGKVVCLTAVLLIRTLTFGKRDADQASRARGSSNPSRPPEPEPARAGASIGRGRALSRAAALAELIATTHHSITRTRPPFLLTHLPRLLNSPSPLPT